MPRFAEFYLEQKPTAATFRDKVRRTLIAFGVSICTMWRRSKFTEEHHKADDDDRWLSRAHRMIYENI